jgi:hypothetical protein
MRIKILPSSPLSPLNELFPQGVPIQDVEVCVQDAEAYLFDPLAVEPDVIQQVLGIAMADKMPVSITFILLSDSELIIPKEWVCTDEQSTAESW